MILQYIYLISILAGIYYLIRSKFPNKVEIIKAGEEFPKLVSIIIPARNEERNIKRLLRSLINLNYPSTEIILVDGDSTDNTVNITKEFKEIKIIEEPERPKDWVGKPWACYTGYKEAKGDILLFTDADTYHHPDSLTTTVHELNKSNGFLSFLTTQEFKSFWEHMLAIIFLIISISTRGTRGTKRATIANGQYMMFTRERYEQLGTHKVVGGSIIEDLAFATHGAEQGYPPVIIFKRNLVTARMYQSLSDINEGFGKNLGLGVDQAGLDSIISAGCVTVWGIGWIILLIADLILIGQITQFTLLLSIIGYSTFVALLIGLEFRISTRTTLYPIFYPIYFIVFEFIVLKSLISTFISKEITWKDRKYQV